MIDFESQNFEFSKQDRQHQSCDLAPQTNKHVALESVEASFDQSNNNSQNFETSNVATPQEATTFIITSSNLRSESKTHELCDLVVLEDVNQNYCQNDKPQRKREQKRLASILEKYQNDPITFEFASSDFLNSCVVFGIF